MLYHPVLCFAGAEDIWVMFLESAFAHLWYLDRYSQMPNTDEQKLEAYKMLNGNTIDRAIMAMLGEGVS